MSVSPTQKGKFKVYPIGSEDWREYQLPNGEVYKIVAPMELWIKEGATGHRIVDGTGVTHWVPVNENTIIRWKSLAEDKVDF